MLRILILALLLGTSTVAVQASPIEKGVELLRQGRYQEAIAPLREARKTLPYDPHLKRALTACYLGAGVGLLKAGELDQALTMFRAGEELAPEESRFLLYRGVVLLKQGDAEGATAALEDALRGSPTSAEACRLLAQALYASGRLPEAQAYLEEALELAPEGKEDRALREKIRRELKVEERMITHQGGYFSVSYVEGGKLLGAQTLQVLQEAYVELGTLFNSYPGTAVPVLIYGRKDFLEATGAPDWAAGVYDGKIRVPVGGLKEMNRELRRVLYHEYAHVLLIRLTRGNIPRWLNEGLAQVAEGELPKGHPQRAGKTVSRLPLSRFETSFEKLSGTEADAAYRQSRDFVVYLLDRYGWPRMLDLLDALGKQKKFDEAVHGFLLYEGEDFRSVERDWMEQRG